jgi:hypothetical protein
MPNLAVLKTLPAYPDLTQGIAFTIFPAQRAADSARVELGFGG